MAKKKKAEQTPPTTYEILSELRNSACGRPYIDFETIGAACEYLDAMAVSRSGLAEFVTYTNAVQSQPYMTHYGTIHAVCKEFEAAEGEAIDDEAQVAVVCAYIDHVHETGNKPEPFAAWLRTTLGLDEPSATTEPEPAPEPAKPKKPSKKERPSADAPTPPWEDAKPLTDITGKPAKYREGKRWIVGRVTVGRDQVITFEPENGGDPALVDRAALKFLKADALTKVAVPEAEPAAEDLPPIVIGIAAKKIARLEKWLAGPPCPYPGTKEKDVVAGYQADLGDGFTVFVSVEDGDSDGLRGFVDVYVTKKDPGDAKARLMFEHPPSQTLAGTYKVKVGDNIRTLEVVQA